MSPAPQKDEGPPRMGAARRPDLRLVVGGDAPSPIADAARRTFEWRSTLAGAIEMLDERSPAELVAHSAMRIAVQLAEQHVADHRRANGLDAAAVARLVNDGPNDLHWEPTPRGPERRPLPRSPLSDTLEQTREWRATLGQATAWLEEGRTPPEVVLDRAMRRAVDVAARYLADQERRRASSPRPRNTSLLAGKRGLIDASTMRLRALPSPPVDW